VWQSLRVASKLWLLLLERMVLAACLGFVECAARALAALLAGVAGSEASQSLRPNVGYLHLRKMRMNLKTSSRRFRTRTSPRTLQDLMMMPWQAWICCCCCCCCCCRCCQCCCQLHLLHLHRHLRSFRPLWLSLAASSSRLFPSRYVLGWPARPQLSLDGRPSNAVNP